MKKILLSLSCALMCVAAAFAQKSAIETCRARYVKFVEQVGYNGVGVRSILDEWKRLNPEDPDYLIADFNYYISGAQSTEVVKKSEGNYLGMKPILELKDSLGNRVYYYNEVFYADSLFKKAMAVAERAVDLYPRELNFHFMKVNAYMSYEKGSPDMALDCLMRLADINYNERRKWVYQNEDVPDDFFEGAMQDFCYSFYTVGTESSLNAFRRMSEKMLEFDDDNPVFMGNLGAYALVAEENDRKAEKIFKKVLKKYPSDNTALSNCIVIARKRRDIKLERKYLKMMVENGEGKAVEQARQRLEILEKL